MLSFLHINPFKPPALSRIRILLTVHLAHKHTEGPHISLIVPIKRLVNHHLLTCLRMYGHCHDLIQLIFKVPVKFTRLWRPVHLSMPPVAAMPYSCSNPYPDADHVPGSRCISGFRHGPGPGHISGCRYVPGPGPSQVSGTSPASGVVSISGTASDSGGSAALDSAISCSCAAASSGVRSPP